MHSRWRQPRALPESSGRVAWTVLVSVVPVMALLVFLGLQVRETLVESGIEGSCPVQAADLTSHAVLLLDLRKPFAAAYESLPGTLLRKVTQYLAANTELRVFALTEYAEAPRMLLGRLCKPYDGSDLAVSAAKDQGMAARDCDNLPAQIPGELRERAKRFCGERQALERRIGALMKERVSSNVTSAHLVEALEETSRDFERLETPRSLYVFSDMMQHAGWYSHLDIRWDQWDFDKFAAQREQQAPFIGPEVRPGADLDVKIFYVARKDVTEHPRPRLAHRLFWERYFGDASVAFEVQTPLLAYTGEPLMDIPTEAERAAEERARADYERQIVNRMRARVAEERTALQAQRDDLAEQHRQWRIREEELRRQQETLQKQEEQLAAERQRLMQQSVDST